MTARMVVVYATPDDPAAFDAHYMGVHVPLAKRLPGLVSYEVSRPPVVSPTGDEAYLVGTLHFASMAAMREAFASEVGKQCAADRRILAPDGKVRMYLFEAEPV